MEQVEKLKVIEKIIEQIFMSHSIAIAGHVSPDGDAVASCLALARCVKKLGKEPVVLLESAPKRYSFIAGQEFIKFDGYEQLKPDLFISCDCGSKERMGKAEHLFDSMENTVVVDHHISNNNYGRLNYVDPHASSTCEMVYDIIALVDNIDVEIASAIYTGIIFDTGGLRFGSTSPDTMVKISKLMEYNIPFTEIYTKTMLTHSYEETQIFSKAIGKMKFAENLPIVFTSVSLEEMQAVNAGKEDLEGIVEYMLNTKGAAVSVFIYQTGENMSKASFRSVRFNVNEIAANWGGGGHVNASGATLGLKPDEAVKEVMAYICERYAKWS
ncbi:bifunctional oligoribonuclease/PAP phosphatase NrnA [Tyzzerella sp. OttesenSCG-928-J15]|nr:bifunctional oligoribonuclease/PAP phosphatase NrnA [Tyzzerella sp. OttesenSCG-928-J15]